MSKRVACGIDKYQHAGSAQGFLRDIDTLPLKPGLEFIFVGDG